MVSPKRIGRWPLLTDRVEQNQAAPREIQAMGLGCDVGSEESVKATDAAIKEKFGRIDVSLCDWGNISNAKYLDSGEFVCD